ncbi:MAG: Flp family type IVb pilin [Planctomycetota bacterium]|jgi:pilus assembly protein Flp/PilA
MFQVVISKVVGRFVRDERGATMLEYGLLVGLIAIVAVAAMTTLGGSMTTLFENASTKVPN